MAMEGGAGELQCVGKLEIAKPKPVGFLCGTLPVPTDSTFPLFQSALLRSPHVIGAPRYQMLPAETDLNTLPILSNLPEKVFPSAAKTNEDMDWSENLTLAKLCMCYTWRERKAARASSRRTKKFGNMDQFLLDAYTKTKENADDVREFDDMLFTYKEDKEKDRKGFHLESNPISQNLSRKCEALAVSGLTEYGNEIDVVAPADILKQIFKIPYSKAQLSVAVHRIGDTLILNTGPDFEEGEKVYRRQSNQSRNSDPSIFLNFAMHSVRAEACDCPPSHMPSSMEQSSSTILPGHFGHREVPFVSSTNTHVGKSQFLDQTSSGTRKPSQGNQDTYFWGTKQNKQKNKRSDPIEKSSQVGEKPRFPMQESDKFKRLGNNGFLRVLFWQFHNFRMLLGSDLLLFSNEKYVAVSLHLWDVSRQVTPLTWLEAWLDNVMASVPELAICYHQNGVVQGYELLKTDDIFLLKGISADGTPAFHPQIVQQNGLSVLRFLQDNCKQDPGAYWLYKGAGEDVIQLFDLSVIPKKHSADDHDESCSSLSSLMDKGRRDSLFSLGTLLYRVAHRLSLSKAPDNRVKCAKFFKKCLEFLSEQDHLVVRAYAHEQFARLILKCYEELELTLEPFLLESEISVTNLEDESSVEMFVSKSQDKGLSDDVKRENPKESGMEKLETETYSNENVQSSATMEIETLESKVSSRIRDSLIMCQKTQDISSPMVSTVADPISSKLVAIHHVSQAIKSLRWKRQLQNTQGDLIDHGSRIHDRSSSVNFSLCSCGDADCIEVCDIREWLPKSRIDHKMWKLVLLLGESYLSLGEAYKEDEQLHRALKVVELACLLYGSMPQYLEDAQFISSMTSRSSCQLNFDRSKDSTYVVTDSATDLEPKLFEDACCDGQSSPTNLFWAKVWTHIGDIYVEYHRNGKDITVQAEKNTSGSEVRMSNEVVKEVKRLKKKLGRYKQNCSTCSLMNCSCQSDRASSGNSASSSTGVTSSFYNRKPSRKSTIKNLSFSPSVQTQNNNNPCMVGISSVFYGDQLQDDVPVGLRGDEEPKESYISTGVEHNNHDKDTCTKNSKEAIVSEPCSTDSSKARSGGVFKFLEGPKPGDVEYNLSAAVSCYREASKAMDGLPSGLGEFGSVLKKWGWVSNELGRYKLENRKLADAEIAFADAIKAFKEVSDHTNIILINCNLGHGRRALAEELVSKMDELKKYDLLQNAYKQAMKSAKSEYTKSLKHYGAAITEMNLVSDKVDTFLCNEAHTQYANTYLRFGMLLAKESISTEIYDSGHIDVSLSDEKKKEQEKHVISASDAFREALSTYEALGELRKQEAAFAQFQLACYYRDLCLKFLDLDHKQVKDSKTENKNRQKAKWYASLAEKNWQKSIAFYSPQTYAVMYLNILMEQSSLSLRLSESFHANTMLEAALVHLLEARHVVEADNGHSYDQTPEIKEKFWNQLQALLKNMLAAALSAGANKAGVIGQAPHCGKGGDPAKLRELYRLSLKSTSLHELHAMHKLWLS
ncbi:hypothetical protein MUK42_24487 [Musa troglodytarum]|uniref:EDRF1 N-terminal domain-containing protein n=1 Tax=Musa troglodytarum TaxID=320322 RepID=A0A9E7GB03_9LILI|nr:hypothetical protein MUK42_24487 [Musa troglodytarum]